jgi:hypothetical protein
MKILYFAWMLSRDVGTLKKLCVGCLVLAALCHLRAELQNQDLTTGTAHEAVSLTDSRLNLP